jgi:hypothetical protein
LQLTNAGVIILSAKKPRPAPAWPNDITPIG